MAKKTKIELVKRGPGRPAQPENADGRWQIYIGKSYQGRVAAARGKSKRSVRAEIEFALDRWLETINE